MTSAHVAAQVFKRAGLFKDLRCFKQFEERLLTLANTKEVGDAFEILVEGYLHTQSTMQAKNVWLVGQVPLHIRKELNLPSDSKGIDGIFETRAGNLVPYQVKYRTDASLLPYGEVSSFLGVTERSCKDRVIFTNARGLSKDVQNRDGLRSVRAHNFHALTQADFAAIEGWLHQKPVEHVRRQPWPYQQEAIRDIVASLKDHSRTTAVMACGTGKTLVALWVAETLEPKTVLVLVPSLALLSQVLPDWCKESKWGESFEYLCVCSDPTVSKGVDAYAIRPEEADFAITTDPEEVRRFLDRQVAGVKVVFSTYQSTRVVAKGANGLKPFDFAVFDEAHKTTGPQAGLFAFGLSDENLPIAKRLFLTATPRHFDVRHRDDEGDYRFISMDDETVYGPVSYRLSFASAVKQGIICPYKIVISITTEAEVDNELLKHGKTLVRRDEIQAKWVATQLALVRAIEKTKASKVITFHSRVALAAEFASDRSSGIAEHLDGFQFFHVNGGQSAADRESLLTDFKTSRKGVITNARCLTEGVDVPTVDMVAFIDPRRSRIDIAQATGRAMRQSKATGKTTGYIVVPLFLEQQAGESEEAALERSGFEEIAMVIAAMLEQDEDLVDVIRQMRMDRGEGKPFHPRTLEDKIEVLGPTIEFRALQTAIAVAVVDKLGSSWDEMFGRLISFTRQYGHCRVPAKFVSMDGGRLGGWVNAQRTYKDTILPERVARLEGVTGWTWDPQADAWDEGYKQLERYSETYGNCLVSAQLVTENGYRLGQWVTVQRTKKDTMTAHRTQQLERLSGWSWDARLDWWEERFDQLKRYGDAEGHYRVPRQFVTKDGYKLGIWVGNQRRRREVTSTERAQLLERLTGWSWDTLSDAWDNGYQQLRRYAEIEGNSRVPRSFITNDGYRLGQWVTEQRTHRVSISAERREKLESLVGWIWDSLSAAWEEGYKQLQRYSETKRHCRVPAKFVTNDGYRLGQWVGVQRSTKDAMPAERTQRLEHLQGWSWDPFSDDWEEGYKKLKQYVDAEGHCRVPAKFVTKDGYRLGTWVNTQRTHKNVMPPERAGRLEELAEWRWTAK